MREQVEVLEDHPGPYPQLADLLPVAPAAAVERVGLDRDVTDAHGAHGRLLEEVEAAQHRRLATAGASDEHHGLVLADLQAHAPQDVVVAEVLLDAGRRDDDLAQLHQRSLLARRCSSRCWTYEKTMVRIQ